MLKTVTYKINGGLDPNYCNCREAFICLKSSEVGRIAGSKKTVEATIVDSTTYFKVEGQFFENNECGKPIPTNVIGTETEIILRYESGDLINEEDGISESDIACVTLDGCAVKAAVDSVGDLVTDIAQEIADGLPDLRIQSIEATGTSGTDGIYIVTVTNGTTTSTFNIDLSALLDDTNTPLSVTDSTSIDFSVSGADDHTLTGVVKISADANNVLQERADGIYVPGSATLSNTPITPTDTASVDLSVSGTDNHTLSADVKLSADANNIIEERANGLYAPEAVIPANTPLSVTDSTSIDFTASGTDNHTLTGVVKRDPVATNIISNTASGLLVVRHDTLGALIQATKANPTTALSGIGDSTNAISTIVINNSANTRAIRALITNTVRVQGFASGADVEIILTNQIDPGTGVFSGHAIRYTFETSINGINDRTDSLQDFITVAAGATVTIRGQVIASKGNATGTYSFDGVDAVITRLSYIGSTVA